MRAIAASVATDLTRFRTPLPSRSGMNRGVKIATKIHIVASMSKPIFSSFSCCLLSVLILKVLLPWKQNVPKIRDNANVSVYLCQVF